MIIMDDNNDIYKTGNKLDYTPKKLEFFDEFDKSSIIKITCGRKHYAVLNKNN